MAGGEAPRFASSRARSSRASSLIELARAHGPGGSPRPPPRLRADSRMRSSSSVSGSGRAGDSGGPARAARALAISRRSSARRAFGERLDVATELVCPRGERHEHRIDATNGVVALTLALDLDERVEKLLYLWRSRAWPAPRRARDRSRAAARSRRGPAGVRAARRPSRSSRGGRGSRRSSDQPWHGVGHAGCRCGGDDSARAPPARRRPPNPRRRPVARLRRAPPSWARCRDVRPPSAAAAQRHDAPAAAPRPARRARR